MSRLSLLLICLSGSVFVAGCVEGEQTQVAAPTVDLSHFGRPNDPDFVSEVYESDVPVLVDFGAEWCEPCQMLKPILHRLETEYEGRLKIVRIDSDEQPALAAHYEVSGIPTLLLVENGELVAMEVGAMPEPQLRQWIESNVDTTAAVITSPAVDDAQVEETTESTAT